MLRRNVGDNRRTREIEQRMLLKRFTSTPDINQFKDTESGIVKDTGELYVRDGKKLWKFQGTEVT